MEKILMLFSCVPATLLGRIVLVLLCLAARGKHIRLLQFYYHLDVRTL